MNAAFDLSRYGLIALGGPDAAKFLQGLATTDVRLVAAERSSLGALCQVNGRVAALFRVFERDAGLLLRLPAPLLPTTLERLRGSVFRARVTPRDAGADFAGAGVAGPGAAAALAHYAGAAPSLENGAVRSGPYTLIRVPGSPPRFEAWAPRDAIDALRAALDADGFARGDDALWTLLEIRAGLPEVEPPTIDTFLPQNLDLERLGGLSFSKGCYPGQEVVARTQHLGELKRRLVRARAGGGATPAPGTPLRAVDDARERDGGRVVRAAAAPEGGLELLAVVPVVELTSGARLAIGRADGEPLSLVSA